MKRIKTFFFAFLLAVFCCQGSALAARNSTVQPYASLYLADYYASLSYDSEAGEVCVNYSVCANKNAASIGVEYIKLYTSSGRYLTTITGSSANGLIITDIDSYTGSYRYQTTADVEYYAKVKVFARAGTGYDSHILTPSTS